MGYLCATCGGMGGLFKSSHAHSDKDSCISELKAENAKLRAEEQDTRNQYTALKHSAWDRIAFLELQIEGARKLLYRAKDAIYDHDVLARGKEAELLNEIRDFLQGVTEKPEHDGLRLGESRSLPYPQPISDDDAKKRIEPAQKIATKELVQFTCGWCGVVGSDANDVINRSAYGQTVCDDCISKREGSSHE